MSSSILIVVEAEVVPGKSEALKERISRLIAHAKATEPGLLIYNWYMNDAETELRIVEQHANSEAVIFHGRNVASFSAELSDLRVPKKITVYGSVSDQLRKGLTNIGADILTLVEGHSAMG